MYKFQLGQAQLMIILSSDLRVWPWPSFYLNKCFKWTTVPNYFKSKHKCRSYDPDKLHLWPFHHLTFKCDLVLRPTWINVSKGTSTPQGKQVCQIILKSMHKCISYGSDKSGQTHARTTHILHWTEVVNYVSLIASQLDKNWQYCSVYENSLILAAKI